MTAESAFNSGATRSARAKRRSMRCNALGIKADGVPKTPGFDGKPVAKVSAKALCEEMNRRGFLEKDEKGNVYFDWPKQFPQGQN
jgi:hypothetical protein